MDDRFAAERQKTRDSVLAGPGVTAADLRQALARGEGPPELRALVAKIRTAPASITDEDWAPLRAAFRDEDQQFEIVLAAILGAADDRFRAAARAVEGA